MTISEILEDGLARCSADADTIKRQIEGIDAQAAILQQHREQLVYSYHRAEGAVAALNELKTRSQAIEEPAPPEDTVTTVAVEPDEGGLGG